MFGYCKIVMLNFQEKLYTILNYKQKREVVKKKKKYSDLRLGFRFLIASSDLYIGTNIGKFTMQHS